MDTQTTEALSKDRCPSGQSLGSKSINEENILGEAQWVEN